MAVQRGATLGVVVVSLSFMVATCGAQLPTGCPLVEDKNSTVTLFANPFNCSTFYVCVHGTPVLLECPDPLLFNDELKVCDFSKSANCVPIQPTLTTKTVITKIVTEIIKPVDDTVAPVITNTEVSEPEVQPTTTRPAVVDAGVSVDDVVSEPVVAVDDLQPAPVKAEDAVSKPEVQPSVVDADVSSDDVLSNPVVSVDESQPATVNADADAAVSDVNSAVKPVENTVDETTNSELLGNLVDANVNLGGL